MYSAPTPIEPAWPPARAEPAAATTNNAANTLAFVMAGMLARARSTTTYAARVISPDLELSDLDARQWRNGWCLLAPPRMLDEPRWALVVVERGTVIKLVIAGGGDTRGSIAPVALPGLTSRDLTGYAKQLGVGAVIVIERGL